MAWIGVRGVPCCVIDPAGAGNARFFRCAVVGLSGISTPSVPGRAEKGPALDPLIAADRSGAPAAVALVGKLVVTLKPLLFFPDGDKGPCCCCPLINPAPLPILVATEGDSSILTRGYFS